MRQRFIAELVGTFVLVFGGVGSAVLAGDKIGHFGVALAFGLALLSMAYAVGPISGCHVNPAVTVGLWARGRISPKHVVGYIVAQIIGAIVAAALVLVVARGAPGGYVASVSGLGANGYGFHSPGGYTLVAAFLTEAVLTFFLVITVLGATSVDAPAGFAGLPIGLVLTLIHLVGIPVTNTSVNPARSIGSAVFAGGWALEQLWLFIIAPLVGAGLASLVDVLLHGPVPASRREEEKGEGRREAPGYPKPASARPSS